jgi:glycosyltransferase involved in cell wall biosynthesis
MTQRSLTITIVTGPWFPTPPGPSGAVERVWGDLARHFARMGHRVTVLSRAFEGLPADEERDGVRTIRLTQWKQGSNVKIDLIKDVFFSTRMFLKCPRADIVVTNAFWLPAMLSVFKRSAGRISMNVQRVPKGQMWLYRRVDRLSAVSKAIADAIIAERPEMASQVRIIPNPIDLGYFRPPHARDLDGSGGRGRTIVFTGRIHPEKGIHVLVEAFRMLRGEFPDLNLRLIGPAAVDRGGGGDEYLSKLRSLAGDAPVAISPPIYDRAQLAAALQEASFYCYPSLAEQGEAQPVAPMEAMATGLVPVVSDIPQFRDYLTPGETGEVFNHRSGNLAENLAASLRRVIADPDRTRRMGEAAAATAQRFGYEQVAAHYLADFYELLGEVPAASAAGTGAAA